MTLDDVEPVSHALARAFFDDPLQTWAIPDATRRLGLLADIFGTLARWLDVPLGYCWVDATWSCAAYWLPPGDLPRLSGDAKRALVAMDARMGPEVSGRLQAADAAMRAAKPEAAHYYLQGVGTDPVQQGRGLATSALAPMLARCDAEAVPAYLESTKERNVPFYEHLGFTVTGLIEITDGPTLWSMWRDPVR